MSQKPFVFSRSLVIHYPTHKVHHKVTQTAAVGGVVDPKPNKLVPEEEKIIIHISYVHKATPTYIDYKLIHTLLVIIILTINI